MGVENIPKSVQPIFFKLTKTRSKPLSSKKKIMVSWLDRIFSER